MDKFNNIKKLAQVSSLAALTTLGMAFLPAKQTETSQRFNPNPMNKALVQPACAVDKNCGECRAQTTGRPPRQWVSGVLIKLKDGSKACVPCAGL